MCVCVCRTVWNSNLPSPSANWKHHFKAIIEKAEIKIWKQLWHPKEVRLCSCNFSFGLLQVCPSDPWLSGQRSWLSCFYKGLFWCLPGTLHGIAQLSSSEREKQGAWVPPTHSPCFLNVGLTTMTLAMSKKVSHAKEVATHHSGNREVLCSST